MSDREKESDEARSGEDADELESHSVGRLSEVSYHSDGSQAETKPAYEFGDDNCNLQSPIKPEEQDLESRPGSKAAAEDVKSRSSHTRSVTRSIRSRLTKSSMYSKPVRSFASSVTRT